MIYACCDDRRRSVLANQSVFNGIDFIDVVDDPSMPNDQRQRTLLLHFLNPLTMGELTVANISITGGERIRNVKAIQVQWQGAGSPPGDPHILAVTVNGPGDFSAYTLSIVDPINPSQPPPGFDQVLSTIDFSFKVECPGTLDCQTTTDCPPVAQPPISISYMAKDFASFQSLMLDRMATILPAWEENHAADLGIMLVDLLAFLGDYLSYQQDAVATEAYLGTARRRTSVRRHVRLVDYPMHDGRNARTWVRFEASPGTSGVVVPQGTQVLTAGSKPATVLALSTDAPSPYMQAIAEGPQVFETMQDVTLFATHNQIWFYTWGNRECCLPEGSTYAFLRGKLINLAAGMVLIFEEMKGPDTGNAADADTSHRCAVRLTAVTYLSDPIGGQFNNPPDGSAVDVTRIDWMSDDALPFTLCLSSKYLTQYYDGVSAAFGNIALADNGRTISGEQLPFVPAPNPALTIAQPSSQDRCSHPPPVTPTPARYNPSLAQAPLTFADTWDATSSATASLNTRQNENLFAQVAQLKELPSGDLWTIEQTLLHSVAADKDFVAEVEDDGSASLRFGDGINGAAPVAGISFSAQYRIGNGTAGNIGANTLTRIATSDSALLAMFNPPIVSVTNPLPASGGLDPETLDEVRQRAPSAFRTQERAVTETDYGTQAIVVDPTLSKAVGTFRWTGSWQTVFISVDPQGSEIVDATRQSNIENGMELYRMAGHDVDVIAPVFVSLELHMKVCVAPGYVAAQVEAALLDVLSNRTLPDGTKGVFHPDNFTFGQTVYLSPIYAAVQNTAGVESVTIKRFQRQGQCSTNAALSGKLLMNRLEIPRLDNDPNFPEHGILKLHVKGGS
jgi:Baseplate J-like protein